MQNAFKVHSLFFEPQNLVSCSLYTPKCGFNFPVSYPFLPNYCHLIPRIGFKGRNPRKWCLERHLRRITCSNRECREKQRELNTTTNDEENGEKKKIIQMLREPMKLVPGLSKKGTMRKKVSSTSAARARGVIFNVRPWRWSNWGDGWCEWRKPRKSNGNPPWIRRFYLEIRNAAPQTSNYWG